MNKRGLLGLIVLIIALVIGGFFIFIKYYDFSDSVSVDEEKLVKVQTTCCPCSAGGSEMCVPESEAYLYEETLKDCPKDLICPQVYNCTIESC